jgi:hypothetical protein
MKQCPTCKKIKPTQEFHKNSNKQDGLQRECKLCCKNNNKNYYNKNGKQVIIERNKNYIERNREFVNRYKQIFGRCVDCDIIDPRVLQFDHLQDKRDNISNLIYQACSIKTLKEEIRKCEIRCANCHQIKTHYS